jgi:hypothetical protein
LLVRCGDEMEKEWRRLCRLATCNWSAPCAGAVPSTAIIPERSAGRLWGHCNCSEVAADVPFGFGVDRFLLLVEGAPRDPRGLPLGQPWCFLGFESSAGTPSCVGGCKTGSMASPGDVYVCDTGAPSDPSGKCTDGSATCLTSDGACVSSWWLGGWCFVSYGLLDS